MGRRFWRACRRFLWCGRWPQPERRLRRSPDGRRRVTDRQRQLRSDGNGRAGDIGNSRLWSDRLVNCSMTTICRAGSLRLNARKILATIRYWLKYLNQVNKKGNLKMATAKKTAPKGKATPKKVTAPAKVVKPVAKASVKKAPVSKTAKAVAEISASIAKLTERKDKINSEINALRDQRTALKVVPVTPAPVGPKAKAAPKAAAPKKAAKPAAKK